MGRLRRSRGPTVEVPEPELRPRTRSGRKNVIVPGVASCAAGKYAKGFVDSRRSSYLASFTTPTIS
jgi:hypothetical protein